MTKVHVSSDSIRDNFIPRLDGKNWFVAGRGKFGKAWVKGGLVWKVEPYQFDGNYSGWVDYIRAVANGELSGPHVPRVKVLLIFKDGCAALMERLNSLTAYMVPQWYVETALESENWEALVAEHPDKSPLISQFITPSFQAFGGILRTWSKDQRLCLDCHGGNVMVRGGRELVVTDPVSDKQEAPISTSDNTVAMPTLGYDRDDDFEILTADHEWAMT